MKPIRESARLDWEGKGMGCDHRGKFHCKCSCAPVIRNLLEATVILGKYVNPNITDRELTKVNRAINQARKK